MSINGQNYIWYYTVLYLEIKRLTNSHCGFMCVSWLCMLIIQCYQSVHVCMCGIFIIHRLLTLLQESSTIH